MKSLKLLIISLAVIAVFTVSAVAQKEKTPVVPNSKIAVIDSKAFEDEKSGIKDLLNAYGKIEAELEPKIQELKALIPKFREMEKELLRLEEILNKDWTGHTTAYSEREIKTEAYKKSLCEFKQLDEDIKSLREKRVAELTVPIAAKIADALRQFGKQNGYAIIMDKSKPSYSAIVEGEAADITREFIRFYNDYSDKEKAR